MSRHNPSRRESTLFPALCLIVFAAVAGFAGWYLWLQSCQAERDAELDELEWRAVTRAPGILAEAWGLTPAEAADGR